VKGSILIVVSFLIVGYVPVLVAADEKISNNQRIAADVLPLPESLRETATVVSYEPDQKMVTLRKGSNGMVCTADRPGDDVFYVNCFHESIFPLLNRVREISMAQPPGSPKSRAAASLALEEEIKAGKWKAPTSRQSDSKCGVR